MMGNEIIVAIDLGGRTKILKVCEDSSVKTLYHRVSVEMESENVDNFNLLSDGKVLEESKFVSDYQFVHLQRIVYTHKALGGSRLRPLPGYIEVTSKPCSLTYEDDPKLLRAKMPCGCILSVKSVETQSAVEIAKGLCTFSCPMCETPWEFFVVRHVLSAIKTPEELNAISRKLGTNFVNPQNDIRQCRMCNTYSMRDFERSPFWNRNRVVCNVCTKKNGRTVEFCWLCGQRWNGGDGQHCGNVNCGPTSTLKVLAACLTKEIYGVKDVPDTRACPGCGMAIQHQTACKHIECPGCHLNFCFVCLKPCENGEWQCGSYLTKCAVAPRQTALPRLP